MSGVSGALQVGAGFVPAPHWAPRIARARRFPELQSPGSSTGSPVRRLRVSPGRPSLDLAVFLRSLFEPGWEACGATSPLSRTSGLSWGVTGWRLTAPRRLPGCGILSALRPGRNPGPRCLRIVAPTSPPPFRLAVPLRLTTGELTRVCGIAGGGPAVYGGSPSRPLPRSSSLVVNALGSTPALWRLARDPVGARRKIGVVTSLVKRSVVIRRRNRLKTLDSAVDPSCVFDGRRGTSETWLGQVEDLVRSRGWRGRRALPVTPNHAP